MLSPSKVLSSLYPHLKVVTLEWSLYGIVGGQAFIQFLVDSWSWWVALPLNQVISGLREN